MDYIIKRRESKEVEKESGWLMIYGRRKTGKTFMLKNLCKFKNYFLVKKSLSIFTDNKTKTIEELIKEVRNLLEENNAVVIDEFQRLDESVLEEMMQSHPKGRLIVSGSSMRITKKFFDSRSPLLGFFTPMKIGLISPSDILGGLKDLAAENRIEFSAFLREPWLIPLFSKEDISEFVYKVVTKSKYIVSSLMGEIFSEEERELSKKYAAILSLIGAGIWSTRELTTILYHRNLIPDPSPNHIIQYLKNLEGMELVESVKLHKSRNRCFYRLRSPVMNIYYYLDDRYDIGNRDIDFEEMEPTLKKLINFEIQNFVADFFAEKSSGRKEYFISQSKEIDFIITQRKKPTVVGEVKWGEYRKKDIEKFKEKTKYIGGEKVFVVKEKTGIEDKEVKIIDAADMAKMV